MKITNIFNIDNKEHDAGQIPGLNNFFNN